MCYTGEGISSGTPLERKEIVIQGRGLALVHHFRGKRLCYTGEGISSGTPLERKEIVLYRGGD